MHLAASDTGGAFCLCVDEPPAGWRFAPHRHLNESETIHVVDGRFEIDLDGRLQALGPGDTIHIPAGTTHSGGNVGEATGRRVLIFSPAGLERLFLEVGVDEPGHEFDATEMLAAAARYGWVFER